MASKTTLKPCPFCGGDAEISVHGDEYELVAAVGCADCTARVRITDDTTTRNLDALERAAVAAWNRRAGEEARDGRMAD